MLKSVKSKIKAPAGMIADKDSLPGWQMTTLLGLLYGVSSVCVHERDLSACLFLCSHQSYLTRIIPYEHI